MYSKDEIKKVLLSNGTIHTDEQLELLIQRLYVLAEIEFDIRNVIEIDERKSRGDDFPFQN